VDGGETGLFPLRVVRRNGERERRVPNRYYSEEFIAQQREMLRLASKASRGARFQFTSEWSHHNSLFFHVHGLDLADPFERKEPYEFLSLC
jgi:hypothetical protein